MSASLPNNSTVPFPFSGLSAGNFFQSQEGDGLGLTEPHAPSLIRHSIPQIQRTHKQEISTGVFQGSVLEQEHRILPADENTPPVQEEEHLTRRQLGQRRRRARELEERRQVHAVTSGHSLSEDAHVTRQRLGQQRRRARELEERQLALSNTRHDGPPAPSPIAVTEEHRTTLQFGLLTPPSTNSPSHRPERPTRRRTTLGRAQDRDAARQATNPRSMGQRRRQQREHEAVVNIIGTSKGNLPSTTEPLFS
ncbi:hypothetical protein BJ912DRAFT_1066331 [Pholiota molesta]|nr:hypothetical protein BJ912DRAFT_1066331 [Pholiota molesta]